jgi:hypothetical protein
MPGLYISNSTFAFISFQILNDVNGNLDAKKACAGALKLHKKYLKKVSCCPVADQVPSCYHVG